MAFATPDELGTYLQQAVDPTTATLVLGLVEADMAQAASVAAVDLPAWAKGLGLAVAARVYTNPVGLTGDALGDYRRNFGGNYLSDDEVSRLAGARGSAGAFSITPYGPTYVAEAGTSTLADFP